VNRVVRAVNRKLSAGNCHVRSGLDAFIAVGCRFGGGNGLRFGCASARRDVERPCADIQAGFGLYTVVRGGKGKRAALNGNPAFVRISAVACLNAVVSGLNPMSSI